MIDLVTLLPYLSAFSLQNLRFWRNFRWTSKDFGSRLF